MGGNGALRLGRRPELDGLRGIAVLVVIAVHTFPWLFPGGALGVDMFFVLSGFLITSLLCEEWATYGSIALRHFWARRALRLLPALALFLVGAVAVGLGRGEDPFKVLASAGLTATYVINITRAAGIGIAGPFGHTWSLAIEEQFYLVWPPLFVLLMRARLSKLAILAVVAVPIALEPVWRTFLVNNGASYNRVKLAPDTRADVLLVGCALALVLAWGMRPGLVGSRAARALLVPAIGFLAAWLFWGSASGSLPALATWAYTATAVSGAALILGALDPHPTLFRRVLLLRPLPHIGRLSYALYLWHLVTLGAVRSALPGANGVVIAVVGIGSAWLVTETSWRLVETRFLRLKDRFPANGGKGQAEPAAAAFD